MKKNMKVFAAIAGLFLLCFCAAMLILALLGVFSENGADGPLSGGQNILTELITPKYKDPALLWQDEPKGEKIRIETDAGTFTVTLYASDAADAFKTFAESGAFNGKPFATVTDSFAQVSPLDNSRASYTENSLAALSGTVGFVLEDKKAASSLVVVTKAGLSGLSEAYLTDNTAAFSEERIAIYREKGGVPELEDRLLLFGQVTEGFDVLEAIASSETNGYTGGFSAESPVTILSVTAVG